MIAETNSAGLSAAMLISFITSDCSALSSKLRSLLIANFALFSNDCDKDNLRMRSFRNASTSVTELKKIASLAIQASAFQVIQTFAGNLCFEHVAKLSTLTYLVKRQFIWKWTPDLRQWLKINPMAI
jgi:hypothetical protein